VALVAFVALAALGGASPPAPGATGTCHSAAGAAACAGLRAAPFVTPAQARGAIAALWNAREHALDTHDSPALARIETGSARLTDQEYALWAACGCGNFYWTQAPRRFVRATVYLPRQTRYPLYFGAGVLASQGGGSPASGVTAMLIVTRSSPGRPWRIADEVFDRGYQPPVPGFFPPVVDRNGYMALSGGAVPRNYGWIPELVSYFNEIKRTGKQPADSRYAAGPLTSQNGLEARPSGYVSGGVKTSYTFRKGTLGGPWLFRTTRITPMLCGDILESATSAQVEKGRVLLQNANRRNWGPHLAPGAYHSITTLYEWSVCIYPDGVKLAVGGNFRGGYPVGETGVRAN
jgi:hypothetical protein